MAGGTAFFGQNQSPRLTTTYLNQVGRKGDPGPGLNVSTADVSGSIVQPYGGFEGGKLTLTNPFAAQKADPDVGPLYGGIYMYVQFDPAATLANALGQIVFWSDLANYTVTPNYTAALAGQIAGVTINATTPGNWDFIQIAGIARVAMTAAGAVGGMVGVTPTVGTPTRGTVTATFSQNIIGIAVLTAPLANQPTPVLLNLQNGFNF